MIGSLAAYAVPGSWDYVRFMAREGTPVLGLPFSWVFIPFVLLLLALAVRSVLEVVALLRRRNGAPE
jgi:TRAP-type C4-dicarboxylate transport system permease small subunit